VIVGDRGRGKTHLACGLVNAFCDLGRRGVYRRMRDYFNDLSRVEWAAKDKVRRLYLDPALLVLDEVQVRDADREWQDNELTDLIDRRWARHRSTVMLANCEPAALWKNLGASIQRRVIESGDVWQTDWPRIKELPCPRTRG
jgi:DNA replication protein DnaC